MSPSRSTVSASSYAPSLYSWCARSSYSSELRNGVAIVSKPPAHEGAPIVPSVHSEVQWETQGLWHEEKRAYSSAHTLVSPGKKPRPSAQQIVAISPATSEFRSSNIRFASSELPPVKRVTAASK